MTPAETQRIEWNGEPLEFAAPDMKTIEVGPGEYLISNGTSFREVFEQDGRLGDGVTLDQVEIKVETPREKIIRERFKSTAGGAAGKTGAHVIKAPMPGLVRAIKVAVGDHVEKTTVLLVLEAMKMENNILAGVKGVVKKVMAEQGNSVDKNVALIEVELA